MTRLVLVLIVLAGCGATAPTVAWLGRSPDGAHRASVLEQSDGSSGQRLVVDSRLVGAWDAVGLTHIAWSESGIVVPVQTEEGWRVWHRGELGPAHAAVGEIHVADTMLVYAAQDRDGWHIVQNGVVGRGYRSILAGSIVIERGRLAFIARDADGVHAVVDDSVGPGFRHIERLGFGAKGELVVYVGYEDEGARIVVDGEPGVLFEAVHELAVAPDEPRWAAIVERRGGLFCVRDGGRSPLARGSRELVISPDGSRVAWTTPTDDGVRVFIDDEPGPEHAEITGLTLVAASGAPLYIAHTADGARVVHDGSPGPRFDAVQLVTSRTGHWAYVGYRRGGSAVVIDGELVFRGEWSSPPVLAAAGSGWAFVIRRAGRRHVVTPRGETEVARPFVDTLHLDADGEHWAIAMADGARRRLRVVVDGEDVAPLAIDEVASEVALGRDGASAARALVASELARATR